MKEIPSSKSSSQLSVCSSGSTNDSGWIFSTRLIPAALLLGAEPVFHAGGCSIEEPSAEVEGVTSAERCVGDGGGRALFRVGCFDGLEGAKNTISLYVPQKKMDPIRTLECLVQLLNLQDRFVVVIIS